MTELDRITVTGIRVHGYHGVFDFEREQGQPFIADVTVWLATADAAASDDLARTVHYGELAEAVHAVLVGDPVDLLETLAQRVADACLSFGGVAQVEVTIHKPEAPIEVPFDDVALTIRRSR